MFLLGREGILLASLMDAVLQPLLKQSSIDNDSPVLFNLLCAFHTAEVRYLVTGL